MSWSSASAARKDSTSGDAVGPAYIACSVARASAIAACALRRASIMADNWACAVVSSRPMTATLHRV